MDLSKFGPKDAKIIRENPDLMPYELLAKGLSNKAFERLTGSDTTNNVETPEIVNNIEPVNTIQAQETTSNVVKPASITPSVSRVRHSVPKPVSSSSQKVNGNYAMKIQNLVTGKIFTISTSLGRNLINGNPRMYKAV